MLVIPAALLVAGIAGFIAGRNTQPNPSSSQAGEAGGPAATRSTRATASSAAENLRSGRAAGQNGQLQSMPASQRHARLEAIMRGENALDRNRALLDFIEQLGPGDFEDAVAHFRSLGLTENRLGEYSLLLSAWAKTDPIGALAYARENTGNRFASDTILTTWASLDPLSAIQWAESNHDGDGANPNMIGVIRGIAASDPDLATRLLTEMPRSRERGSALDAILPHLLTQGTDDARAWIESLGDDSLRNGAMMRVAERFAETDPAGTVSWLLDNPGEATQRRMDDVYRTWMRDNPDAALGSISTLPAGEARSDALRGVVSAVSSSDPAMAISLMDRHAADIDDGVVRNFVWRAFDTDPAAAATQIARIDDQRYQYHMYRRILDRWMERDPNTASTWIRSNTLPDNVIEHLQRQSQAQP
ncbi:MAG TPA: hypothetical protein VLO11_03160 [Luteolibacter sp.]|nr:hypothetical protein [Luteolibacter sp.]